MQIPISCRANTPDLILHNMWPDDLVRYPRCGARWFHSIVFSFYTYSTPEELAFVQDQCSDCRQVQNLQNMISTQILTDTGQKNK